MGSKTGKTLAKNPPDLTGLSKAAPAEWTTNGRHMDHQAFQEPQDNFRIPGRYFHPDFQDFQDTLGCPLKLDLDLSFPLHL